MAIIIFPPNPNQGDTFTADNGVVYTYDGVKWEGATGNLLNVTTDVIPSANVSYSLGNSTNQWQDLWVSGNTIYINSVPLTVDGNTLQVDGANVVTGNGGGGNTGDITFTNANISTIITEPIQLQPLNSVSAGVNGPNLYLQAGDYAYTTSATPVVAEGGALHLQGGNASIFQYGSGTAVGNVGGAGGPVVITSTSLNRFSAARILNNWTFDNLGNLTLPDLPFSTPSINYANGQPYGGSGGNGGGSTDWANIGNISGPNGPQDIIIGYNAGGNSSGQQSVAIGYASGQFNQGVDAVAIGPGTAENSQGNAAVAIGVFAGQLSQGVNAVAIGYLAGSSAQGNNAVAIGTDTGGQGANSIAIGSRAGGGSSVGGQANNTIILNATGEYVTGVGAQTDSFYVAPVRNDTGNVTNALYYNTATFEISYGPAGGGSTGNFVFDGNVVNMPLYARLNSGGIGNTNAAEFGTEVISNGTAIVSSQIYMGAGTTEVRGIVDSQGRGLMYTGVEGAGFAGTVGIDPDVTNEYVIAVGPGNIILLGAATGNGTLTTTEYTAGVGALNANGTINGLLASSSNVVISNGNTAGWSFGADGNLSAPGSISATGSITAGSITQFGIGNINGYNGYFANNLTAQGTVQATSFVAPDGNGTFIGNVETGVNALYAGLPGFTVLGSNVVTQFAANVNSYAQVNLQNLNTGDSASGDYIITADIGNDSTYYLDLGLASSTHTDPYFFGDVSTANDGYLTVVGPDSAGPSTSAGPGNLILGSSNGLIKMFVGNASQANVIATVSSSGLNVLGNITTAGDSGNITGANVVSANTLTALSITQTGTGNINGYNGYFANNVTVQGTLQATGLIVPQGNGTFFGDSVSGNSALFAGVPGYTLLGSNVVVQFAGNANSYSQVNFQNIDSGSAATTDYIATADTGTNSTYYLDMGIAGSAYDNTNPNVSLGTSLFPLDSYVFSAGSTNTTPGGNLVVGTITPERVISFIAGGVNDTEIVQIIANTGISVYRSISSTGNIIAGNISTLETGGNITGNTVTAATALVTTPTTVDNLPSAVAAGPGARSFVIDSNTITFYSNVGNAGSNSVPVFSDGTSWRVG